MITFIQYQNYPLHKLPNGCQFLHEIMIEHEAARVIMSRNANGML
jgi:hypothetical protein